MARIRKKRFSAIVILCIVGMFLLFGLSAFTVAYRQAKNVARLKRDGTLVTAYITSYRYDSEDGDYTLYYEYTDEAGKTYTGSTGQSYGSYDAANAHYGEPVEIYIDAASGDSVRADYPEQGSYFYTVRIVLWCVFGADIFTIVVLAVSLLVTRAKGTKFNRYQWAQCLGVVGIVALFGLMFFGISTQRLWLEIVAFAGLSGGALLVSVIVMIVWFKRAGKPKPSSQTGETLSETQAEVQMRERVNTTSGLENTQAVAEWQLSNIKKIYRNSSSREKKLGCMLLIWLLGLFAGIPIFAAFRIVPGMIACFCGFCGTILLAGIINAVHSKCMRSPKNFDMQQTHDAEVLSCAVSSSTSTGSRTTHVMSVTYRIVLSVNGAEKIAYSREFYEMGEKVRVWLHKKNGKAAYIVDDDGAYAAAIAERTEKYIALLQERAARTESVLAQTESSDAEEQTSLRADQTPLQDGEPLQCEDVPAAEEKTPSPPPKKPRKIHR